MNLSIMAPSRAPVLARPGRRHSCGEPARRLRAPEPFHIQGHGDRFQSRMALDLTGSFYRSEKKSHYRLSFAGRDAPRRPV